MALLQEVTEAAVAAATAEVAVAGPVLMPEEAVAVDTPMQRFLPPAVAAVLATSQAIQVVAVAEVASLSPASAVAAAALGVALATVSPATSILAVRQPVLAVVLGEQTDSVPAAGAAKLRQSVMPAVMLAPAQLAQTVR